MKTAVPPAPRLARPRPPDPRRRAPSSRAARVRLAVALGLLCALVALALTLLLARPPASGDRRSAVQPIGGYTGTPAGTVLQATEVTATPSRGEPTDVVPSAAAGSPTPANIATPGSLPPTFSPGQTPTPPPPGPISVEITCAQGYNNVSGQVCVHTSPGAALSITVTYCSGLHARNTDLQGPRYADGEGNYRWTWVPETTCSGSAVAHVTATGPDGSAGASTTFPVP